MATTVEMLSGRKKKDYAAESSADLLEAAAGPTGGVEGDVALGADAGPDADGEDPSIPADEPIPEAIAA